MSETKTEPQIDKQTEAMGFHLIDGEPVVPPRETEADAAEAKPAEDIQEAEKPASEPEPKGQRVEYAEEEDDGSGAESPLAEFAPELLQRAERWQMDEKQVREFETPENLDRFLSQLEQHAGLNLLRAQATRQSADESPAHPASERPQADKTKDAVAYAPYECPEFEGLLDPDKYEPDFIQLGKGVKGLSQHVNSQLGGLAEQVQAVQKVVAGMADHLHRQRVVGELEEFHQSINGLGEEWHDTFGQGGLRDFPRNSRHGQNRWKLLAAMRAVREGAEAVGESQVSKADLMQRALHAAFHEKALAQTEKEMEKRLKQRRKEGTARPTSRRGKQLTGPERAVEVWNKAKAS